MKIIANICAFALHVLLTFPTVHAASFEAVDDGTQASIGVTEIAILKPYYPPAKGEWETVGLAASMENWDMRLLAGVVDYVSDKNTRGFIILEKGKILLENYWLGTQSNNSFPVFSVGKTVAAILLAKQINSGLITSVNDPVSTYLGDNWLTQYTNCVNYANESDILIRHVINMTTGIDENYAFNQLLCANANPIGQYWDYNTRMYNKIIDIMHGNALDLASSWEDYSNTELFHIIGMGHTHWNNRYNLRSTARDLARFGLFLHRNGAWEGVQVVANDGYLQYITGGRPYRPNIFDIFGQHDHNYSYGYLTWLNGKTSYRDIANVYHPGPIIPQAPDDLYAALGSQDNKIYVVPSLNLVVVRTGGEALPDSTDLFEFDRELWQRICDAHMQCLP